MRNQKQSRMLRVMALVFGIAFAICLLPNKLVKADVVTLAEPKDAAQTVSVEDGVRVEWTKVTGATQYFYSYSADNKTYTAEAMTGNNGTDNFVNIVNKTWKAGTYYYVRVRAFNGTKYSAYVTVKVATAPKAPAYVKETAADSSSVTLSWAASEGATGYCIKFGATAADAKDIQTITTTSCRLTGLKADSAYYVAVYPVKKVTDKFSASMNFVDNAKVITMGGPVTGLKLYDWDVKSNLVMLQWSNATKYESGYQIEIYKADGKTCVKTYTVPGKRSCMKVFKLKALKNTPFQYRVRAYTNLAGKKSYGDWSAFAYAIPQADVTATKVSNTSVKLTWDKVAGAKSYTIYRATSEGGKYKKVATTKKRSYTVKSLDTYKDYYFFVKANKITIGGKARNSTKLSVNNNLNVFIYKYQDEVTND